MPFILGVLKTFKDALKQTFVYEDMRLGVWVVLKAEKSERSETVATQSLQDALVVIVAWNPVQKLHCWARVLGALVVT